MIVVLAHLEILNLLGVLNLTLQFVNELEALDPDFINILVFALFKEHDCIRVFINPIELVYNIDSFNFLLPSFVDLHDFADLTFCQRFFHVYFLQ